jgi:UDP-glucose 4-epimerase
MIVLLTGASSFTGYWFARELVTAGHVVLAPLRGARDSYSGIRAARLEELSKVAEIVWDCPFGEQDFLNLAKTGKFDVLSHHAAQVTNYRSADFDICAALAENTKSLRVLLSVLLENGAKAMVLTGSVFEPEEGAGTLPLRAFSPYGISKSATASVVRYWCNEFSLPLGKFVISNPFGPYEDARFCSYLINTWQSGRVAEVRTPRYVRDNIHVSLLAKAYAQFVLATTKAVGFAKLNPSGYVETQGAFARRFAHEMEHRLNIKCALELFEQGDYPEPMVRINTDPVEGTVHGWSEVQAWDDLAAYYQGRRGHAERLRIRAEEI